MNTNSTFASSTTTFLFSYKNEFNALNGACFRSEHSYNEYSVVRISGATEKEVRWFVYEGRHDAAKYVVFRAALLSINAPLK